MSNRDEQPDAVIRSWWMLDSSEEVMREVTDMGRAELSARHVLRGGTCPDTGVRIVQLGERLHPSRDTRSHDDG